MGDNDRTLHGRPVPRCGRVSEERRHSLRDVHVGLPWLDLRSYDLRVVRREAAKPLGEETRHLFVQDPVGQLLTAVASVACPRRVVKARAADTEAAQPARGILAAGLACRDRKGPTAQMYRRPGPGGSSIWTVRKNGQPSLSPTPATLTVPSASAPRVATERQGGSAESGRAVPPPVATSGRRHATWTERPPL